MDVTLVLTHRCNLACRYCYAGQQARREMDRETLEQAVSFLFCDGADIAQLSFFGGEPFLAFDSMQRAVNLARRQADALGRRLLLQCTTNARWFGRLTSQIGWRAAVGLRAAREREREPTQIIVAPIPLERTRHRFGRREALYLLATGTATITTLGGAAALLTTNGEMPPPCESGWDDEEVVAGPMETAPEDMPEDEPEPEEDPPPPDDDAHLRVRGDMLFRPPATEPVLGDME